MPGQRAARLGVAHRPERCVVVDLGRLVRKVRDDEERQADRGGAGADQRGRDDAQDREEEQERHAAAGPVAQRTEDRRHERVDPHAENHADAEQHVAVALPEPDIVGEPQTDGTGYDGEAEDRVGEVVQRPGNGHASAAAGRQSGETAKRAGAARRAGARSGDGAGAHGPIMARGLPRDQAVRCPA